MLQHFIQVDKYLTLDMLNHCIKAYNYRSADVTNKPSELKPTILSNDSGSISQSGNDVIEYTVMVLFETTVAQSLVIQ